MVYNFQKESLKEGKFPSLLSFISCWLECRWNGWMPHTLWICDKEAKQPPMTEKTETSHHLCTHEREVISGLFQATLIWRPWFHTNAGTQRILCSAKPRSKFDNVHFNLNLWTQLERQNEQKNGFQGNPAPGDKLSGSESTCEQKLPLVLLFQRQTLCDLMDCSPPGSSAHGIA